MRRKNISFTCKHIACAADPISQLLVEVPDPDISAGRPLKKKLVYCKRDHRSTIEIPDTWDVVRPSLGEQALIVDEKHPPFEGELSE